MLDKKVYKLINTQINEEMYSAYLYLDFANFFEKKGLKGFANYYTVQAKEEMEHALKFRSYLLDNGEEVVFDEIKKPDVKIAKYIDVLEASLKHEQYITSLINKIYGVASDVKEYKTLEFLSWFVKEQVEEEKNAEDLLTEYKLFGDSIEGLYLLNSQLANRK